MILCRLRLPASLVGRQYNTMPLTRKLIVIDLADVIKSLNPLLRLDLIPVFGVHYLLAAMDRKDKNENYEQRIKWLTTPIEGNRQGFSDATGAREARIFTGAC